MTDVIQIAKERRDRLADEIAKLNDFIQMAEALMKWHQSRGDRPTNAGEAKPGGSSEPVTLRPGSTAGGT
jgi:hypothetical protein